MKVVMLLDVKKVGQRGAVVEVADGYAMNVLFPKKQAIPATPENLKRVEKEALAAKGKKDMDGVLAKKALEQVHGKTITIDAKANPTGGLFEAIREKQINDMLRSNYKVSLPESAIRLDGAIKKTGTYEVPLFLHEARARISVIVKGK